MPAELAARCAELLDKNAVGVIAARAATCAGDKAWQVLVERHRRPGGCDDLAQAARELLSMHKTVGDLAAGHQDTFVAAFVGEVVSRLALMPFASQLAIAARGLQIAGICVCVRGGSLDRCACLIDVLKAEGEERVQVLVMGAMEDWRGLPRRMGEDP